MYILLYYVDDTDVGVASGSDSTAGGRERASAEAGRGRSVAVDGQTDEASESQTEQAQ